MKKNIMSFSECIIQDFIAHFFGFLEILILILTAVGCYTVIYKSQQYMAIRKCRVCAVECW